MRASDSSSHFFFQLQTERQVMYLKEKAEQFKTHVVKNKERYIGALAIVGTNVLWYLATKNNGNTTEIDVKGDHNSVAVTNVGTQNFHAPKRLSYIVTDGERWWQTQREAARALGVYPTDVSKHINHGQELKDGITLERVGVRS